MGIPFFSNRTPSTPSNTNWPTTSPRKFRELRDAGGWLRESPVISRVVLILGMAPSPSPPFTSSTTTSAEESCVAGEEANFWEIFSRPSRATMASFTVPILNFSTGTRFHGDSFGIC